MLFRSRVEGTIPGPDGKVLSFRSPDINVPPTEVSTYFADWESRWNVVSNRALLRYDGAADNDGRDTFLRNLRYKQVKAGARGTFDAVEVKRVPVGPRDANDAREWALALTLARASTADAYVAPSNWPLDWQTTLSGTPLEPIAGSAPTLSSLLDLPTLSPRLRWLLAAGTDL